AGVGLVWRPLLWSLVAAGLLLSLQLAQAISASRAASVSAGRPRATCWKLAGLTTFLHLTQPIARLIGRVRHGLTPWRASGRAGFGWPWRSVSRWSESWQPAAARLRAIEAA